MKHHIKTTYISGWYTVGIPLIIFFLFFLGLPIAIMVLYRWNIPAWAGISLYIIGCVLGVAVNVVVYPVILKLANRGEGELTLENKLLCWRKGKMWHELNLHEPYHAEISCGASGLGKDNASVSFKHSEVIIHFRGAQREEILQLFPEPYFLNDLAVTPEKGLWGFNLSADDDAARSFFHELLEDLWATRYNNAHYNLYCKFPWHSTPRPSFTHIEVIDSKNMNETQQAFIKELESQVISAPTSTAKVTPDYLLGSDAKNKYFIFPLGYVSAEEGITGSDEQSIRYLKVRGLDKTGHTITIKLPYWVKVTDSNYAEGAFLVRFVNRRS